MFLIIKNIFKIHPFFYILMFVCFITGNIIDFFLFFSLISIHELGHILFGLLFSWKVEKIIILPFGCLTIFNNLINTSLFEQFVVTLMGPLFQVLFFLLINHYFILGNNIYYFNYVLLFFNLLPIYPLDGSKFLYIFFSFVFPFKYCYLFMLYISLCLIFFLLFFVGFDLMVFLVLLLLFIKVVLEFRNIGLVFNRFLFEKYNYDLNFKRLRRVNSIDKMFLCCRHLFYDGEKYITEREKLIKMFDKYYKL